MIEIGSLKRDCVSFIEHPVSSIEDQEC